MSNPPAMSGTSAASGLRHSLPLGQTTIRRIAGRLRLRKGGLTLWLGVLLASFAFVFFAFVFVAASHNRPDLPGVRLALSSLASEARPAADRTVAELTTIGGFQRRGTSLVGEVTTRDGAVMRLVFDARTHTLIGLRVVDGAEARPRSEDRPQACPNHSPIAPLP